MKKYTPKTLTPVQVGQVVKALVLLGARKVTVEEVEKAIIAKKGTVFNA